MTTKHNNGYIKLHRKFAEWEWYSDVNVSRLFMHLLLTANWEDNAWKGISIKRGQRLASLRELSDETSLTYKEVRTSIGKLKRTGELQSQGARSGAFQGMLLTIVKYKDYQDKGNERARDKASDGHAVGTQGARLYKDTKKKKEEGRRLSPPNGVLPIPDDWVIDTPLKPWIDDKNLDLEWLCEQAMRFKTYYIERRSDSKFHRKNWNRCFQDWINRELKYEAKRTGAL